MNNILTTVLENGTTITITKTDSNVVVEASVPKRVIARDPKVTCSTSIVLNTLVDQGVETGDILIGDGQVISNSKKDKEMNGRWIFETPRKPKTEVSATNRSTPTAKPTKTATTKRKEVSKARPNKLLGTEDME